MISVYFSLSWMAPNELCKIRFQGRLRGVLVGGFQWVIRCVNVGAVETAHQVRRITRTFLLALREVFALSDLRSVSKMIAA